MKMKYDWRSLQNSIRETTRDSLILLFDMYDHCELICCLCNDCHYVFEQDYKRLLIRK